MTVQYLLAYSTYISVHVQSKKKCSVFNVKTNNCPRSCRWAQKDVGTIDLQVTYDAKIVLAVRKANVRLEHGNCKPEVRFLRASHVASGNPCPNKIVCDTYDWHVKRPFVLEPF